MRLYHFKTKEYGLAAIRDRRLKISKFSELNDPADHVGIHVTGKENIESLHLQRQRFDAGGGIVCMSYDWQEPLLWGHYADAYKGMCLVFEVDLRLWFEIEYRLNRPTLEEFKKERFSDLEPVDLFFIGLIKSKGWSYEREWRRFCPFDDPDSIKENNHYFKKFDDVMKLKGALFGSRMEICSAEIDEIYRNDPEIRLSFTRFSDEYYQVEMDTARNRKELMGRRKLHSNSLVVPSWDLVEKNCQKFLDDQIKIKE